MRHGCSQSINQNSLNSFYQSGSFFDNELKSGEKKIFFNNGDSATLRATTFIDTLPEINEIQNKDKIIENDAIIFGCNQQRKCFYQTSASNNHKYFTLTDDPRLNLDKLGYFVRANPNAQIVFDKTFLAHFATNKAEEQELITIIEGCKIFIARSCNYEDESMANFIWQNQELFFKHTEVATHSANSIFNEVYSKSGQPSFNFFKAGINQIAEVENWHITAKSHNSAKTIREEESPIKTRKKEYLWGLWQSEQEEYFLDIERIQKFANTKPTRQQKIDYFYDIINNANYPINVEDLVTSLNCFQEESAEDESYKTSMLDNFLDKTNFKHNDILYIIDNLQAKALTFKSFIDYLPALKNANSIFSAIFFSLKDRILEEEGLIIAKKFTEEGDLCFCFLKQKDINQEISRSENDQILLTSSEKINNNKSRRFTALNKFPEAKISKVYNSKTKNQILNTKQNNINKFVFSQHGTRLGGNDLDLDTKFWQKFFKNNKDTKNLKISDISCFGSCLHKIIDDSQEVFNFLDRKQELSFQIIASNINNSTIAKKLQNYQNFSLKKNNSLLELEKREKLKIVVARDNKGELTINIYNLRQLNEEEIKEIKDSQNSTKLDYKKIASTAKTCQKIIDNDKFEDIFEEDLSENDFDLGEIDYDLIEEASTNDNESFVAMPFTSFNPSIASKVSFKQLQL